MEQIVYRVLLALSLFILIAISASWKKPRRFLAAIWRGCLAFADATKEFMPVIYLAGVLFGISDLLVRGYTSRNFQGFLETSQSTITSLPISPNRLAWITALTLLTGLTFSLLNYAQNRIQAREAAEEKAMKKRVKKKSKGALKTP